VITLNFLGNPTSLWPTVMMHWEKKVANLTEISNFSLWSIVIGGLHQSEMQESRVQQLPSTRPP